MSDTPDPLKSKMPTTYKLAVLVCEIRDGGAYWPLLKVHQSNNGCVIESGERAAARCLQVLPHALDLVTTTVAEREAEMAKLEVIFREQFEALLPFPQAPEIQATSTPTA